MYIDSDRVPAYAAALPAAADVPGLDPVVHYVEGPPEAVTAFILCVDAINFGSAWWPTVRKRPGRSGYLTMAGGLADRFRERGPERMARRSRWRPGSLTGTASPTPRATTSSRCRSSNARS